MRFLGNIEAKLDAKNRVFVPALFRRVLLAAASDENVAQGGAASQTENPTEPALPMMLYLRKDVYQDCIVAYPSWVWEKELTLLRSRLNKWNPDEQDLYRQFMLEAEAVEMDANGRILIPRRLSQLVGITTELRFLGVDDTMEIWPKAALESPRMDAKTFKLKIQALMASCPDD